ncbi:MAG: hypothetical protein RRX93_03860 [Bacteroidales bacterium]
MKRIWVFLISALLTVAASMYQRSTGPSYPVKASVKVEGEVVKFTFPRSGTNENTKITIPSLYVKEGISGASMPAEYQKQAEAYLFYKHYPSTQKERYEKVKMTWENGYWIGFLPAQAAAGKLMYYAQADGQTYFKDEPMIIRYKSPVPAWALIPHILAMFLAMFFAVSAGIFALLNQISYVKYMRLTLIALLIGGFIFGPLVQKYAFGVYWSGFPLGLDFTDNKTLIALLAFLIAWTVQVFKKRSRWITFSATVVMLIVFCVPHSMGGSELNRETGLVESSVNR